MTKVARITTSTSRCRICELNNRFPQCPFLDFDARDCLCASKLRGWDGRRASNLSRALIWSWDYSGRLQ